MVVVPLPGPVLISHVCDVNVHMSVLESADSANQKCAMSNGNFILTSTTFSYAAAEFEPCEPCEIEPQEASDPLHMFCLTCLCD